MGVPVMGMVAVVASTHVDVQNAAPPCLLVHSRIRAALRTSRRLMFCTSVHVRCDS